VPEFKPGLYQHYRGGFYRALFLATHHETNHAYVVYVPLEYPKTGVRVRELGDWFGKLPAEVREGGWSQSRRFEWVGP
jgi:hypothetical protein